MSRRRHRRAGNGAGHLLGMLAAMRTVGLDVDACAAAGMSEAALAQRTDPRRSPSWPRSGGRPPAVRTRHAGPARRRGRAQGTPCWIRDRRQPPLRARWGRSPLHRPGQPQHPLGAGPRGPDGLTTFEEHAKWRARGHSASAARVQGDADRQPHALVRRPREVGSRTRRRPRRTNTSSRSAVRCCCERAERPALRRRGAGPRPRSARSEALRILESHAARVAGRTTGHSDLPRARPPRGRPAPARRRAGDRRHRRALATSERSLQRKLQTEGVSFRDVVNEARHKLALV